VENKDYNIIDILKIPFKCSKGYAFLIAFKKLTEGLIPSIQVLVTASFLDTAIQVAKGKKEFAAIVLPLSLLVILIAYTWLFAQLIKFVDVKLEFALREKFRVNIIEKVAKLKYKHIENQETWDLISRVSKKPEVILKNAYINILSLFSMILRVVGLLLILITQIWWAGVVILLMTIPLVILAIKGGRASYGANREVSKYKRKYEYLGEVLTGREAVSERTLFGFTDKINEKWRQQYEIAREIQFKTDLKHFIRLKISSVITALISILMSIVLIKPVLDRALSIGMFISIVNGLFSLVQMMSWQLSQCVNALSKNREYLRDLSTFAKLSELESATDLPSCEGIQVASLEFKNVSFKYPGTDNYILKNLSFNIEKGMHYAFVGSNGAGKTTIIKLITGLYEEYEGEILINGENIKNYNQGELKSICSVVYQDFAKYYISVKDNISIGNINDHEKEIQEQKIRNSIRIMNFEEAIESLPKKLNTPLGKIKSNGKDISYGQWQRIAIARSIISSSSLRILDEPTAALDPISENSIYEEFKEISKGGTTIFISHRLGSTKLAKEIFVLDNGTITEKGSHQELMEANGVYAQMYESQRSWYL
jgi:ATP-binding cassette subfamily B protein